MGVQLLKSPKLVLFGINLPKKGIPPEPIFTKFVLGEDVPGPHPHAKFHRRGFKNIGLQPQKLRKIAIFGINFPLRESSGGPQGAQLQTACNDTIIVLKITLLHSVSVITNFVIPKRDKKADKKYHTFSSTGGACPTIPTIIGMVIEEVRPIFAPS